MNKLGVLLTVLSLCNLIGLQAQQVAQEESKLSLSLEEAQAYALEHNYTMMNASLDVKQQSAARWQVIASMLPQVEASLSYSSPMSYQVNYFGTDIEMTDQGDLGLTASMAVSGNQIVASLLSDIAIEAANINQQKTEQDISADVTQLYVSVLATKQTILILEENQKNMEQLKFYVKQAVEVGAAEPIELDQISVQIARFNNSINMVERNMELANNSLLLKLGLGVDSKLELTQNLEELLDLPSIMQLLNESLVLDKNYTYQLTKVSTEMSKKQVSLAAMDYVPSISAYYKYSGKTYFDKPETMPNTTPPNMLGVSLNVPIWSSGVRAANVKEKQIAYEAALNTQSERESALRLQDKQLRFDLTSAFEDYQLQKSNVDISQRVFDNISQKYEQGYASSQEITNEGNNLLDAQNDYVSSMLKMVKAYVDLRTLLNN